MTTSFFKMCRNHPKKPNLAPLDEMLSYLDKAVPKGTEPNPNSSEYKKYINKIDKILSNWKSRRSDYRDTGSDPKGWTILHHLADRNISALFREESFKLRTYRIVHNLLDSDIDVRLVRWGDKPLSVCDKDGNTPLHIAALKGNTKVLQVLIELSLSLIGSSKPYLLRDNEKTLTSVFDCLSSYYKETFKAKYRGRYDDLKGLIDAIETKRAELVRKEEEELSPLVSTIPSSWI